MRTGAYVLSLLSAPLNVHVLRALEEEPRSLIDLRRAVGSPPQTTMRGNLKHLTEIGVLERRRQNEFPGTVGYELTGPGNELLAVADVVQNWLALSPPEPVRLGSVAAKSTIKALTAGWSSGMVRALAARPLSLTDLNRLISGLNYPSLERRLGALRLAGLVEPCFVSGRGTPYEVTGLLRRAVAPLAAAAQWERRRISDQTRPAARTDLEAFFLLAVPMLELAEDLSGDCRLAVEFRGADSEIELAGALVSVREGRVVSCVSRLRGEAAAWITGAPSAWLDALVRCETDRLEVGGDCGLAVAILDGLHRSLSLVPQMA